MEIKEGSLIAVVGKVIPIEDPTNLNCLLQRWELESLPSSRLCLVRWVGLVGWQM